MALMAPGSMGCRRNEFRCAQSNLCMNYDRRCDGRTDCPDSSDEMECSDPPAPIMMTMWPYLAPDEQDNNRFRTTGETKHQSLTDKYHQKENNRGRDRNENNLRSNRRNKQRYDENLAMGDDTAFRSDDFDSFDKPATQDRHPKTSKHALPKSHTSAAQPTGETFEFCLTG